MSIRSAEGRVLAWFRDLDDNGCLPNRRNQTRCDRVVEECSEVFNSSGSKMLLVKDAELVRSKGSGICCSYLFL